MTNPADIQAAVYTRWHQFSVPFGMAIGTASLIGVLFNRGPVMLAIALCVIGILVPPLVAFRGFPTRNAIKVTPEGLTFSRRAPVAFADLASWGTDDFLKLVRPGRTTLLVSALDLPNRERLLREFQAALAAWQQRQPGGTQPPRRTYFYGTIRARAVGALIVALGLTCAVMAMNLREPSLSLAVVGGLGALFGLVMLLGRRV
ncbi:hypothetical protein [Achromobacter spanius]|uniref:hypothetical protein n=1 Tax=Achromobacter spanius TaxID=217203 RepID=UPI0038285995